MATLSRASQRQKLIVALLVRNGASRARNLAKRIQSEEGQIDIEQSSIARTFRKLESRGLVVRCAGFRRTNQVQLPVVAVPEQIATEWLLLTKKGKEAGQVIIREHKDGRSKFELSALDSDRTDHTKPNAS